MERRLPAILTLLIPGLFAGCSMCCAPHDYDYPTIGGSHQRLDSQYGRVGSVFSDPQATVEGPGPDSNLKPHPTGNGFDDGLLEEIQPRELDAGDLPEEPPEEIPAVRRTSFPPLRGSLR